MSYQWKNSLSSGRIAREIDIRWEPTVLLFSLMLLFTSNIQGQINTYDKLEKSERGGQMLTPLSIDDLLRQRRFGSPAALVSPDGQEVLYTACRRNPEPRLDGGRGDDTCDLVSVNAKSRKEVNLTHGIGSNEAAAWSPDSSRIAFVSKQEGKAMLCLTDLEAKVEILGPARGDPPIWLDDHRLVFLESPSGKENPSAPAHWQGPLVSESPTPGTTATIYRSLEDLSTEERATLRSASDLWVSAPDKELAIMALLDTKTGVKRILVPNELIDRTGGDEGFGAVSPDGEYIAYAVPHGPISQRSFSESYDIVLISVTEPTMRSVVAHDVAMRFGHELSWSPDGHYMAWITSSYSLESGEHKPGGVYLYDKKTKTVRCLTTTEMGTDFGPSYATGSRTPVWLGNGAIVTVGQPMEQSPNEYTQREIWRVNVDGPIVKQLVKLENGSVTSIVTDPQSSTASIFGGNFYFLAQDTEARTLLYAVKITDGRSSVAERWEGDIDSLQARAVPGGNEFVYVKQSASETPNIWIESSQSRQSWRLTDLNPRLESLTLGKAKLLSYLGPHGESLHAALILPPSWRPGTKVPVVVDVYPYSDLGRTAFLSFGCFGQVVCNPQFYATRGYAMLVPDASVNTDASGQAKSPMKDIVDSEIAGIDEAIRLGYVDPHRIATIGQSAGGYNVYALIASSSRFGAAVVWSGFSDWIVPYLYMSDDGDAFGITQAEANSDGPGVSLWENRDRFTMNSPLFFFDKVTTPTLIVHGTKDYVGADNAKMSFSALRRLGKDVQLVLYKGMGHGEGNMNEPNLKDAAERTVGWFDRFLCPNRVSPVSCTQ